ncbi:AGE family epimerase/isomerase [Halobacteria archaeon AArc-curdl1]|uniref:AGE family epimerase/isomerase n=1 Tax=Natronosalvus hydrolyticus TaxID=2979988 RepID=A0AAP2Z9V7_9EURY|nr:AGE family epimerase/isomerase [Halobacteria archaeon AArc-curdl1]
MTSSPAVGSSVVRHPWVLRQHVRSVLEFYYPNALDDVYGGFVAQLDEEDGHLYDGRTKHVVATARFVVTHCIGVRIEGPHWCRSAAERGLHFLLDYHWDDDANGFDWITAGTDPEDRTRYCYGHAFALLACAHAASIGIERAQKGLERTQRVIRDRFWEAEHGLPIAETSSDWSAVDPYRGLNATMHLCEASIAAYEATGESRFLEQAVALAELVRTPTNPASDHGFVWEHYTADWEPDWAYNRNDPEHTFRPWGYQPGHQLEWAKLLCLLDDHRDEAWFLERATELFDAAVEYGWDDDSGGFYYTLDRDGEPLVTDRYGWPIAEAIGAGALLATRTTSPRYWELYDECWQYARENLINHRYGNWRTGVTSEGDSIDPRPRPAVEPGYHPIGNTFEAMRKLERTTERR